MFLNRFLVEEACHKTVIVLDRGPKFANFAGTDITLNLKDEQGALLSGVLQKTLWNCSAEAVLEYHRVVSDLFPHNSKQLRFVVSDYVGRFLTPSWPENMITHEELLEALSTCDAPQASGDVSSCTIINGIALAIEAISESTNLQQNAHEILEKNYNFLNRTGHRRRVLISNDFQNQEFQVNKIYLSRQKNETENKIEEDTEQLSDVVSTNQLQQTSFTKSLRLQNASTMIIFTTIEHIKEFETITETIYEQVNARNEYVSLIGDPNFLLIDKVNIIIINILDGQKQKNKKKFFLNDKKSRGVLNFTLISTFAGASLIALIHKILQDIYYLVSTTISGIPMKEEAQQGQSVNYDVELLHHRDAHKELLIHGILAENSKIISKSETGIYDTICLKWCTSGPKLKSDKFPLLRNFCYLTPANVNSRPSVCLTSFVLSGKCVMLEVNRELLSESNFSNNHLPNAKNLEPNLYQKLISHYLCRDEISGSLVIRSVSLGENATLNGFLTSQEVSKSVTEFDKSTLNYSIMSQLINASTLTIDRNYNSETNNVKKFSKLMSFSSRQDRYETVLKPLQRNICNLTRYFPLSLRDSFIFNIIEKFEPLFLILQKITITVEEFEECKKIIYSLVTSRNGAEPITLKNFECNFIKGNKKLSKEEQFSIVFDELAKIMNNFSHISIVHNNLLNIFVQTSGINFVAPILNEEDNYLFKKNLKKKKEENLLDNNDLLNKKKKKSIWSADESINLLKYFTTIYDDKRWIKWKDFVGRKNAGDQAQTALYPNLKLNEINNSKNTSKNGESIKSEIELMESDADQQQQQQHQHRSSILFHQQQTHSLRVLPKDNFNTRHFNNSNHRSTNRGARHVDGLYRDNKLKRVEHGTSVQIQNSHLQSSSMEH